MQASVMLIISGTRVNVPKGDIGLDPKAYEDHAQSVIFQVGASNYPIAEETLAKFETVVPNHFLKTLVESKGKGESKEKGVAIVKVDLDTKQEVVFPLIVDYMVRVAANPSSQMPTPIQIYQLSRMDGLLYQELFDIMFPGRRKKMCEKYKYPTLNGEEEEEEEEEINQSQDRVLDNDGNIIVVLEAVFEERMYNPALVREVQQFIACGKPEHRQKSAIYQDMGLLERRLKAIPAGMPYQILDLDGYQCINTMADFLEESSVLYWYPFTVDPWLNHEYIP